MNKKGFTILEVLIAVFILALMSMMIWQITNNSRRGAEKASSIDSIYQEGRVSLNRFVTDVEQAFLVGPTLQGKLTDGSPAIETVFIGQTEGDGDRVDFVSFSHVRLMKNEKKSDQAEIGYYVADCPDSEEKMLCLMRRESAQIDKEYKEGGSSYPVAKNIKKFDLEYYDNVKQEWRQDWSSKDPAFLNRLPRAVRATLVFYDPSDKDKEISFATAVMLPMSGGLIDF